MDLPFDLWHLAFVNLIQDRAPPNFEIRSEERLTIEPQRADLLLLRRIGALNQDDQARVLRALWPRLGLVTILEYKSPADSAFRPGDLLRLVGYGFLYDTAHLADLPRREDLTLVLVVASITPTLLAEIARMGWTLTSLGGGYGRLDGVVYTTFVVITDDVTETERDEYLRLFSHRRAEQGEALRWLSQFMRTTRMKQSHIEELPGYEELFQKLVEAMPVEKRLAGLAPGQVVGAFDPEQLLGEFAPAQRVAGLAPEQVLGEFAPAQRVAGLSVEERLAGLSPEERLSAFAPGILAWPVEVLRLLPEDYVRSLPPEAQEQIQKRLRGGSH